jgi:hypothetical protein
VRGYLKHTKLLAGALAFVVGLALVAPPAFAAGPAPDPRPITAAAAAKVEAMPATTLAQAAPATRPPTATAAEIGHKPFFKTTQGAIALVLMAGTLGYMGYSMSNDRVKSPAR